VVDKIFGRLKDEAIDSPGEEPAPRGIPPAIESLARVGELVRTRGAKIGIVRNTGGEWTFALDFSRGDFVFSFSVEGISVDEAADALYEAVEAVLP
jgi:hypothetical protein